MPEAFDEDGKILTRLGLTPLQAQVYLALTKLNKATIKTVSTTSKIDRANVYRVLIRLHEINLVEKFLGNPTIFKALPLSEGLKMLMERKEKEDKEIKMQAKELLKKYKQTNQELHIDDKCEIVLVPSGKLTVRKVEEMVDANLQTHDLIIYWSDFEEQVPEVIARWKKLLQRDVKVRILVYLKPNCALPESVLALKKFKEFKIKQITKQPKSTISIIDGNQAFLSVSPQLSASSKPGLWVSNPGIVGLVEDYFEVLWRNTRAF
jgi:sugar-specific transcriptional regulator TrmB